MSQAGNWGEYQTRGFFSCVDCYQFLKSMTLQVFRLADMTRSGDLNMEDGLEQLEQGVVHGISCLECFMVFAISGLFCCLLLWDARNLFLGMPPSLFRRTRFFFGNVVTTYRWKNMTTSCCNFKELLLGKSTKSIRDAA